MDRFTKVMRGMGMFAYKEVPFMFYNKQREFSMAMHAGEIHATRQADAMVWVFQQRAQHLRLKADPYLVKGGYGSLLEQKQRSATSECWRPTPLRSFLEKVLEITGMVNCNTVSKPAAKSWTYQACYEQPMFEESHRICRGLGGQHMYIAAHKPEQNYAAKEAARKVASPTHLSMRKVSRRPSTPWGRNTTPLCWGKANNRSAWTLRCQLGRM